MRRGTLQNYRAHVQLNNKCIVFHFPTLRLFLYEPREKELAYSLYEPYKSRRYAIFRVVFGLVCTKRELACVASVSVTENLVPRSFFAPKQHGNAYYAGYERMSFNES